MNNTPDNNPNPVLQIAKDGTLLYNNKASAAILKTWNLIPGKALTGERLKFIKTILKDATAKEQELACDAKFYALNFIPVSELSYVYIYGYDISEQIKARKEIESLSRYPSENPNPVLRVSQEGKIIYANHGSSPLLKFWNCNVNEYLPEDWRDYAKNIYRVSICEESEIDIGNKVFLMMFSPVPESEYVCIYGRDITELKKAQHKLEQALDKVEKLKDQLKSENIYLQDEIKSENNCYELITVNDRFKEICSKIDKVAITTSNVLIQGETGTGKELVARAIHAASKRKDRPLIKLNCAVLAANLIESELFGHEKGAFTGAHQSRIGRFEIADGGTIFLDEIGELPIELQPKLLRVLQEGEFERLGDNKTINVDVRVIAATNRNLEELMKSNQFREDLYYRLSVFPIETIPLRHRKEDICVLTEHFVKQISTKMGKKIHHISSSLKKAFDDYDWPGNVRELENVIERALILSEGDTLELHEQLHSKKLTLDPSSTLSLKEMEKKMIFTVLEECRWVIEGDRGAAKRLGIPPSTLRTRIKQYGLKRS